MFSRSFIGFSYDYSTLTNFVPAPCFRKSFNLEKTPESSELCICGLGFYDLFINGVKITKGYIAPYISNPDDIIYYDLYNITPYLCKGENVIGVILGNGIQNNPGGYVWDFDKAKWKGAPRLALSFNATYDSEKALSFTADTSFKTQNSPIIFDDFRCGEYYDARLEQPGWANIGFDDSHWGNAVIMPEPRGEARLCEAPPVVACSEIKPVSIIPEDDGYLYDFGINTSGLCRLEVEGFGGQEIILEHGEVLVNGRFYSRNLKFDDNNYVQKDIYICRGGEKEVHVPSFTFHGFRYVLVKGITPEQAVPELLTYIEMHSDLKVTGGFKCSDETLNSLQEITLRSTYSNFFYFPMDCPHREKNGWTADAALSAEHTLLNYNPEDSYREWLRNICKAQNDKGALPGIIPTGGWGFHWGNGPAWDCALVELPYQIYRYKNSLDAAIECSHSIVRYLEYLNSRIRTDGLIGFGLGDWCHTGRASNEILAPLELTDTLMALDICKKAKFLFEACKQEHNARYAEDLYARLYAAARKELIDEFSMTAKGNCQTSQAMCIYYDVFKTSEKHIAVAKLLDMIKEKDFHMDVGVLGGRVIFHVLSNYGYTDMALKMIKNKTFPSYFDWLKRGATTLWEDFWPVGGKINSRNHHFWGNISHWFIRHLAGINYSPACKIHTADIAPNFPEELTFAEAYYISPLGKIFSRWERSETKIVLNTEVPEGISGDIILPQGWIFQDGFSVKTLRTATNYIIKKSDMAN